MVIWIPVQRMCPLNPVFKEICPCPGEGIYKQWLCCGMQVNPLTTGRENTQYCYCRDGLTQTNAIVVTFISLPTTKPKSKPKPKQITILCLCIISMILLLCGHTNSMSFIISSKESHEYNIYHMSSSSSITLKEENYPPNQTNTVWMSFVVKLNVYSNDLVTKCHYLDV